MTALDAILDEASSRLASEEQAAENEIREAFSCIAQVPLDKIEVPYVAYDHVWKRYKVATENMGETLVDLISSGYGQDELLRVLSDSSCPLVAKLRKVLEDKHVADHATAIAEARA
jgi:hypothetical protein